jgi:hypothetical protein
MHAVVANEVFSNTPIKTRLEMFAYAKCYAMLA